MAARDDQARSVRSEAKTWIGDTAVRRARAAGGCVASKAAASRRCRRRPGSAVRSTTPESMRPPTPRSTPSAAGLRSSTESRLPRVAGESSSATACAREQQRLVEALLDERLDAEPLGVGGARRVAGLAALVERHDAGHEREREQRGEAGEQRPQAAVRAPLVLGLVLRLGAALVEEVALELVQVAARGRRPSRAWRRAARRGRARRGRARAACQSRAACDQVLVQPPALGVLLEPAAQARPLAQQRLVRDLDRARSSAVTSRLSTSAASAVAACSLGRVELARAARGGARTRPRARRRRPAAAGSAGPRARSGSLRPRVGRPPPSGRPPRARRRCARRRHGAAPGPRARATARAARRTAAAGRPARRARRRSARP